MNAFSTSEQASAIQSCPILLGDQAISRFLGLDQAQFEEVLASQELPIFRLAGQWAARQEAIVRALEALEDRGALHGARFSEAVFDLRSRLKMTQHEFGQLIGGVHQGTVARWEAGKHIPSEKERDKVAQLAGYADWNDVVGPDVQLKREALDIDHDSPLNVDLRAVPGFRGLFATSQGEIFSSLKAGNRLSSKKFLRQRPGDFLRVKCQRIGSDKWSSERVQDLVALAFMGPQPTPLHTLAFKSGDRTDCRTDNLEWVKIGRVRALNAVYSE